MQLGPGRKNPRTHHRLAHTGSAQARGQSGGAPTQALTAGVEAEDVHVVLFIHPQDTEGSSRKVRIQETVEAKPELALAYLEYLFNHKATREKVLALGESRLKRLHAALGSWRVRGTAPGLTLKLCVSALFKPCLRLQSVLHTHLRCTTEDPRCPSAETALSVFGYRGRLGAHLQHSVSLAGTGAFF